MDIGVLAGRITLDDDASGALKSFSTNLDKIGSSLTGAGKTLTLGITAPLVAAAGASLLLAGNFEMSMTRLVSLAGVSQDELEGVKQSILDLAPATGIGPQALAEAMTKVSSTVSDTSKALAILDTSAKLSAAGMGTALDVAGALTAVVNSYAASGLTAARAADILAQAVKDGGTEAKELAPVLANVVPIAAQMGVSFEEVAANLATLTKLGVPTAEAVTQLTSVMTALLKETDQGSAALATVGMTFAGLRAEVKEKGLMETLVHLSTVFKGNETALTDVFGRIEALKNVMGTAGVQASTYAEVLDNVKRSSEGAGVAAGMFEAVQGKQMQTWSQVSAAAQVVAIKLGDTLAPAMGAVLKAALPMIDVLSKVVDWFAQLPAPVQLVAGGLVALAAAAGLVLIVVGSIASGIASLTPLIAPMGVAFGLATGPIGLVMLAVTGLVAAVVIFRNHMRDLERDSSLGKPLVGLKDAAGNAIISINDVDANMTKLGATASGPLPQGFSLTIDKFKEMTVEGTKVVALTAEQVKAAADYKEALAAVNIKIAEATRDIGNLSVAQEMQIQYLAQLGLSNNDIATKLKVSELAIKRVEDAWKDEATAQKLSLEIDEMWAARAGKGVTEWAATVAAKLKETNALWNKSYSDLATAEATLRDMKLKASLDTTSYQLLKIKEKAEADVAALTSTGEVYKRHSAAIMEIARIESDTLVNGATSAMTTVADRAVAVTRNAMTAMAAFSLRPTGSQIGAPGPPGAVYGVNGNIVSYDSWVTRANEDYARRWSPPSMNAVITARASGGPVSAGSPYLVGESGPELFTPGASGMISPNGAEGGMVVNANIVMNYPIVNDASAQRALGKNVGAGIVKQMMAQGWRPPQVGVR